MAGKQREKAEGVGATHFLFKGSALMTQLSSRKPHLLQVALSLNRLIVKSSVHGVWGVFRIQTITIHSG